MGAVGDRRIVRDPAHVLTSIAESTGHDVAIVGVVAAAVRVVVDDLLAGGHIVITDELFLSFGDSPTRRALRERLASADPIPAAVLRLDHEAIASWLGLDLEVYADRPLASRSLIGKEVFDLLGARAPARPVVWDILEAWDSTFASGRTYKVSTAGREAAFENWLVGHLDLLAAHGLPVVLAHQQYRLPNGKRPDLICRAHTDTLSLRAGDWVVVELKSTRFHDAAADQVEGYVEQVTEHLATGDELVVGLLITDGADHSEVQALTARGIAHLSLSALGYRIALEQEAPAASRASFVPSPRLSSVDRHSEPVITSSLGRPVIPAGAADFDGPATYRNYLTSRTALVDADKDWCHAVACDLWARREQRRARYVRQWGDTESWPAQHPATVVEVKSPRTLGAAVCIRCDWLVTDLDHASEPIDLHADAKSHALAHTHQSVLERGKNPPRERRSVGIEGALDDARANGRRAARRFARRDSTD